MEFNLVLPANTSRGFDITSQTDSLCMSPSHQFAFSTLGRKRLYHNSKHVCLLVLVFRYAHVCHMVFSSHIFT